jgi:hypothetical protein
MKYAILITAASALLASPSAFAQGSSTSTPGQQMQDRGSATGSPGASGYAPGQQMQDKGSAKGTTGASGYAPGHTTTNANTAKDRMHKDKSKSKY